MLRIIRKYAYTILSRHFYLGIGVGFFLASLTFAHFASADETLYTDSTYTNGAVFNSFSTDAGTTTVTFKITDAIFASSTSDRVTQIQLSVSAYGDEVVTHSLFDSSGNAIFENRSGTVQSSSVWNFYFNQNELTDTICTGSGCTWKVTSSKNYSVWRKSNPDLSSYKRDTNSKSPSGFILGTTTPPEEEEEQQTFLNFSFTQGNVASTSCETIGTTTTCEHHYYPNVTQITPLNLFLLFATFLLSFSGTYWIIRQLT